MTDFVRVPETDWQNILDAVRGKTGSTEKMLSGVVASEIAGIEADGNSDSSAFVDLYKGTITDFTATAEMGFVRPYLFYKCKSLKTLDLSQLPPTLVNGNKSYYCLVGTYACSGCTNLTKIILPDMSEGGYVQNNIFDGRAFKDCTSLPEIITDVSFDVTSAHPSVFENCTSLRRVIMPNFKFTNAIKTFIGCTSLEMVDIKGGAMNSEIFKGDAALKTLILRNGGLCALGNVNIFAGTPFAADGTGGTVYVPEALIERYQNATNWSTLYAAGTCTFVAIEGSEYE